MSTLKSKGVRRFLLIYILASYLFYDYYGGARSYLYEILLITCPEEMLLAMVFSFES